MTRGDSARWRVGAEWGLRLVMIGLLTWYLARVLGIGAGGAAEVATSAELRAKLVRWSTVTTPVRAHVALDYPPPLDERDWFAALAGAGTRTTWSGTALVPTAVVMEPLADPARGADLTLAAPNGTRVILRDALGSFDSVTADASGARVYLPSPPKLVKATVGPVVATAALRDSLRLGRLLVLGHAGWETKFTTAALEERGWKIDALMAFSPKGQGDVRQGAIGGEEPRGPIDTATYAAVLAIDTVAFRYADQIVRYVRSGGGLLLWPEAAMDARLAALAPAVPAKALADPGRVPSAEAPRSVLVLAPLEHLKSDALALEQQQGRTAVAVQRVGPGRILELGYLNTWRWRMTGLDGTDRAAPDAHREWLARLVASVAYVGRSAVAAPTADAAPLATLVDRLGAPSAPLPPTHDLTRVSTWIFGLIVAAALTEWASRRLRGAR